MSYSRRRCFSHLASWRLIHALNAQSNSSGMAVSAMPTIDPMPMRNANAAPSIKWEKFESLMDHCGNDAPVLWMAHQRGYDLYAMRKRESELERENRLLREENAALMRVVKARS